MGAFDDIPITGASGNFGDIPKQRSVQERLNEVAEMGMFDKFLAAMPSRLANNALVTRARGVVMGAADPIVGAVQLGANAIGQGSAINKAIDAKNAEYEAMRGQDAGFDGARLLGNVISPANLVVASRVAPAVNTGQRIVQGAKIGALTGAAEPVLNADNSFFAEKAGQATLGAIGGAALAPVLGKAADYAVRRLSSSGVAPTSDSIDNQILQAIEELGQNINEIPPQQLEALRNQVSGAFARRQSLNPAELLRRADFEALGMEGTAGQISRDAAQFSRERNLRGLAGVGDPLMERFNTQSTQLADRINSLAPPAANSYQAGTRFVEGLKGVDEQMRRRVSGLYQKARESSGKDLDVPLQGLAQDYARIVGDFGDKVPQALRAKFAALGLDPASPSNQKQLFTVENADQLLKNINQLDPGFSDKATSTALGELRSAIKSAVLGAADDGGVFAPAVKAASNRFKIQDAIPALKAAAEGNVAPDDFVRRFLINGKTDELKTMSKVLTPELRDEARGQIADVLKRAAFGEGRGTLSGETIAPERYMATIRRIGVDKLGVFFSSQEVQDILRVGRVNAYINKAPANNTVNNSNTASTLMNFAGRIPGVPATVSAVQNVTEGINNRRNVKNALAGLVNRDPADLTAEQRNVLALIMAGGVGATGAAAGGFVGQ
jgi:hypothetical protein